MPEIAWIMAPTTSPSSATWPSISSARSRQRAPCASRSSVPDGRTHISPKSSPKSEMRLPWVLRSFVCTSQGRRSSSILCGSEHPVAQKFKSGTAVHGSFDDLQPVDLPLDRAGAPGQRQGGMDGIAVLAKASGEALEAARLGSPDPGVELIGKALLDHGRERFGQLDRPGDRR